MVKEGVLAQVGVLLPLLALVVILVFFLTVVEGCNGGGAGDELVLSWIPARFDCHGSIAECLAGDEFELGMEAARRILDRSAITPFLSIETFSHSLSISQNPFLSLKTILKCEMGQKSSLLSSAACRIGGAIFERFDRDRSGKIDTSELREALLSLGFVVSPTVLDLLVTKFDKSRGKSKAIEYDNFIECCLTVKGLRETFKEKDRQLLPMSLSC
ncbi:calcium-binding protein [Musa troglodytarum]|uniref:Calcium-binding protein n=1 Tax=Musa troglodytarum TaxID=320322 RepID=A0A9E7H0A3_9LILI|nr:calcium-binding protein [Musa troglodytarum]